MCYTSQIFTLYNTISIETVAEKIVRTHPSYLSSLTSIIKPYHAQTGWYSYYLTEHRHQVVLVCDEAVASQGGLTDTTQTGNTQLS